MCTVNSTSYDDYLFPQKLSAYTTTDLRPSPFLKAQLETSALRIDACLRAELIDLYFVWQNPWFPVLDESMFRKDQQQGSGRYFSPLLLNCVLAAGSRFSDRPELRTNPSEPCTVGEQLLQEAEILLHYDLKSPSLTTIQAVSILIVIYCVSCIPFVERLLLTRPQSQGADAAAWLHQGTAHRLALDMGFNFDATSVLGSNQISAEEDGLRRQIYWSLYCTDKLHASYSGRVCTMLVRIKPFLLIDMDVPFRVLESDRVPQKRQGAVELPWFTTGNESSDEIRLRSQRTTTLLRAHVTQSQILEKLLLGL